MRTEGLLLQSDAYSMSPDMKRKLFITTELLVFTNGSVVPAHIRPKSEDGTR